MSFNYRFTCLTIDKEIGIARDKIYSTIKYLLEKVNGQELSEERIKDITSEYELHLYCDVEDSFEKVRETNSDIRHQAELQIEECNNQVSELQDLVEDLRVELKEKDLDIHRLNNRIEELQSENEEIRDSLYQI